MPIYEFECGGCGHRFDRLQKLSDEDPSICPVCAAPQLHRRVSAPSFRLAGSGWYETDFKKEGDKKRNLVEGSSGSSAGAGENSATSTSTSTPAPAAAPAAPAPSSKPSAAE